MPPLPEELRAPGIHALHQFRVDQASAGEIHVPAEELRGSAWSTPAEAQQRLSPLLVRRAAAALDAVSEGVTAYLEDRHRVV